MWLILGPALATIRADFSACLTKSNTRFNADPVHVETVMLRPISQI